MKIFIEMNLQSNYKLNWSAPKPTNPLANVYGWFLEEHPDKWSTCFAGWHGNSGWMENGRVLDHEEGSELPDTLYVLIHCSGEWDGVKGGSSWYANTAFISQDKAQVYVEKNDGEYAYYWIVTARKQD